MNYYIWPSQMFYCNSAIKGLADIKGKKVRVQGTSQGDLVEALGGTGVTIPFAEVVPALQRGAVDCGITGTMPAYKAGWHEVTSHVLTLPVGFSVSFTIASLNTWNKLDDKTKAFIDGAIKGQTDKWWQVIIDEDKEGLNCTTGTGPCSVGKPGKLVKVEPPPPTARSSRRRCATSCSSAGPSAAAPMPPASATGTPPPARWPA